MAYLAENENEKRAIRETRDGLLRDAAKAARRTVLDRLQEKETIAPAERKGASLALEFLARIFSE